jgi:hypothetical protein
MSLEPMASSLGRPSSILRNRLIEAEGVQKLYWNTLVETPSPHWIRNVRTEFLFAESSTTFLPITINNKDFENSYVASPYNGLITYPLEEMRLLPSRVTRQAMTMLAYSVAPWLKVGSINRVVVINNWCVSTNLYPALDFNWLDSVFHELRARFPKHAILLRSLNNTTNRALVEHLSNQGFLLVPSRQVYFYDGRQPEYFQRHNVQTDIRHLNQAKEYRLIHHDELSRDDDERIAELYALLYLGRYSQHNPQYTAAWIRLVRESKLMEFFGLRSRAGDLDGVIGCWAVGNTVSGPIAGYDTTKPQTLGLYRNLMAIVLQLAADRQQLLNLSSGAASFKRLRGGKPAIEYTAVDCRHLSPPRRFLWKLLAELLRRLAVPLLEKYEL